MKIVEALKGTDNSTIYRKVRRKYLAEYKSMHCDRCPPHRGENRTRTPKRSWKNKTKRKRQHKTKG
jgi:hypothetical protein